MKTIVFVIVAYFANETQVIPGHQPFTTRAECEAVAFNRAAEIAQSGYGFIGAECIVPVEKP